VSSWIQCKPLDVAGAQGGEFVPVESTVHEAANPGTMVPSALSAVNPS
jgi:hypothetical protein